MKFLIDKSMGSLGIRASSRLVLGQLLTPLTRCKLWDDTTIFAVDNGGYTGVRTQELASLLLRNKGSVDRCLFVACPDVVGSHRRTAELWGYRDKWTAGWPTAFVAQDGAEDADLPWGDMDAIFIGGKDPWKDSQAVVDIVKTAVALGIWVHVGRVNTPARFMHFYNLGANSCDGSGVSRYDHMFQRICSEIDEDNLQNNLFQEVQGGQD